MMSSVKAIDPFDIWINMHFSEIETRQLCVCLRCMLRIVNLIDKRVDVNIGHLHEWIRLTGTRHTDLMAVTNSHQLYGEREREKNE